MINCYSCKGYPINFFFCFFPRIWHLILFSSSSTTFWIKELCNRQSFQNYVQVQNHIIIWLWAYNSHKSGKKKHIHLHLHRLALGKVPFWLVAVFAYVASYTTSLFRNITPSRPHFARGKESHNTGNFTPYSLRTVCGFFNVPRWNFKLGRYCETGPTVYSPYPRRLIGA